MEIMIDDFVTFFIELFEPFELEDFVSLPYADICCQKCVCCEK